MPTVARIGPYRFFFYAGDRDEPEHVHIERDDKVAKIWLDPIRLENSDRFDRAELRDILRIVEEQQAVLREGWRGYFKG